MGMINDGPGSCYRFRRAVMVRVRICVSIVLVFIASPVISDQSVPLSVVQAAASLVPELEPDELSSTAIPGLYVAVFGAQVVYISSDGSYLLTGDLIELESGRNLTEVVRSKARRDIIDALDESEMVVFRPNKIRSTITIFTDISCPYCVKLHEEIRVLSDAGVKVRYLAYPRAGIPSQAHDLLVSVWCSANRQQALTDAKAGRTIDRKRCDTPIHEHMAIAEQLGLRGTPTIILQDGTVIPGYMPANELIERARAATKAAG